MSLPLRIPGFPALRHLRRSRVLALTLALLLPGAVGHADQSARTIVERAHAAAGEATWRELETLQLRGHGTFYRDGQQDSAARANDYRMWRVLPDRSKDAHRANGMMRFDARSDDRILFQISFDGVKAADIRRTEFSIDEPLNVSVFVNPKPPERGHHTIRGASVMHAPAVEQLAARADHELTKGKVVP